MNLVRIVFVALAVLLPTTWTIAKAADEPPAGEKSDKSSSSSSKKKSSKKGKKGEAGSGGSDTEKKGE